MTLGERKVEGGSERKNSDTEKRFTGTKLAVLEGRAVLFLFLSTGVCVPVEGCLHRVSVS